ncbi:hypothetical protein A2634_05440 [Candidatus Amesbacteria bacterium RIFCSPHIGHO2_01_FULL_48_32]|uniref:Phosphatidic acid phosphatase type 2/haloperoxidase domain-containing protein n=1 Tax=Candidatus Amesbacteria bacterium RIFCSPLOWO2_01_FULL_48_25 TaxID=1797259 RepID=A0A1F4ZCP4_9BACT|nr:MAG: hypothetical protein A2634_05440 [Candidatus Amesbacteria bacterium RIFCSPHIGHO2_01_FULL_48_32]OGD04110.1 MAG: hypothetical protein A2989_01790 [Candidatus Amesbacteria bacterium RIFCSPLOWO2_01_FULL_48_25]OGM39067.1 MAG: hypothetical protein A3E13_03980 [Candidatus Woesebacteria bacterium RIFCSPHIGHO2_12_FULL_40_20]HJZ05623.1 phosphatase PAP2 family protein [Patescibacteria group bacterium]
MPVWNVDLVITQAVQAWVPVGVDTALSVFSLLGSFEIITLVLAIWVGKREGLRKVILVVAIFALGMGVEIAGKMFIPHPGPTREFHRYRLPFVFPSSEFSTGNSFPSGHSFRTVFLTVIALGYVGKNQRLKLAWIAFAAIMLVSRVSLGEHWASDVVGGSLLGWGMARIA